MSSMVRATTLMMLLAGACVSVPAHCADGSEWDQARARLMASQRGSIGQAITKWRMLSASDGFTFNEYASFLLTYPGFPMEEKLRTAAEKALERESPGDAAVVAYFDREPPLLNRSRARYALALAALGRPEARATAIAAWRGGTMSDAAETALFALHGRDFSPADHDARMNALLWDGAVAQAQRQIAFVSPAARDGFMERLAITRGAAPGSSGVAMTDAILRDPGYVYARARQARTGGNIGGAIQLLSSRPPAAVPPLDPEKWVAELLRAARGAGANLAVRIAASADDTFAPGTDVSRAGHRLRDDYTSLMWLGGTKALWDLGDAARAAPLFYRYGAAARTPQTRSKGFYWAGRALARAGDQSGAARYFEMAAQYPDHFYGMLALERLGRPLPDLHSQPRVSPTREQSEAFAARPLTLAVREVARDADWPVTVRFFKEIAEQAESEVDHVLVADLAREIGRRDLAVILGQSAHADGYGNFRDVSFPMIPVPPGTDWTMTHAITRQESQFSQNAISHAGARGLMQLMPGTAREQAGKMGLGYDMPALISNPTYNIRLGSGYFARMMDYYRGSYPLAVGAYNAGPGNVNRWIAANGDPRNGGIDWVEWIERIPIYETRNYVQRVLENAVVYEALNPGPTLNRGTSPLSRFLGKRNPG